MDFEPLSLHHQKEYEALLKDLSLKKKLYFSEYDFANLYLFKNRHDYQVLPSKHIKGVFRNGGSFIIPLYNGEDETIAKKENCCLYPIKEENRNKESNYYDEDSDYLYKPSTLIDLPGRQLSSRRNLLKQFLTYHKIEKEVLNKGNVKLFFQVLENWQQNLLLPPEDTDYFSCKTALENFDILGINGKIILADKKAVGFWLGKSLNPLAANLHFVKHDKQYHGVVSYLYKDFAMDFESVNFLNLEQDLGIPSLKQAKMAYHPDELLHKWRFKP